MTKEQKLAIKAMLYAFDRYGERLIGAVYLDRYNSNENRIDFGEAYNISYTDVYGAFVCPVS